MDRFEKNRHKKTNNEMELLDQLEGILEEQLKVSEENVNPDFKRTEKSMENFIKNPKEAKKYLRHKKNIKIKTKRCMCKK